MEHFRALRWTTGSALSVRYAVQKYKRFFASAVGASVLKLIYHRADTGVHLLLHNNVLHAYNHFYAREWRRFVESNLALIKAPINVQNLNSTNRHQMTTSSKLEFNH